MSFPELTLLIEARCTDELRVSGRCRSLFHLFDQNENGVLDVGEVDERTVRSLDRDGDGLISGTEMASFVYRNPSSGIGNRHEEPSESDGK